MVPHAMLIHKALQESQRAFYAQRNCETLVKMVATLQMVAWGRSDWIQSNSFTLLFEELLLEMLRWMEVFSRRGWLSRLELSPVADQQVFQRIKEQTIELLQHFSARDQVQQFEKDFQFTTTSEDLSQKILEFGGLIKEGNKRYSKKNNDERYELLEKLDFYLARDAADYRRLYDLEVEIVLSQKTPGPHQCIRHECVQLIWFWAAAEAQQIEWKVFWECLQTGLKSFSSEDQLIGNIKGIKAYINDEYKRETLQKAISQFTLWSGHLEYVNAIEVDIAFIPTLSIESNLEKLFNQHTLSLKQISDRNNEQKEGQLMPEDKFESADEEVFLECQTLDAKAEDSAAGKNRLIGRGEILQNLENIFAFNVEQILHVYGVTGIGKSAISLQLAENLYDHKMWNSVYYVNLRGISDARVAIEKLCTSLGIPRLVPNMPADRQLQVWGENHGGTTGRIGLVIDNLDSILQNYQQSKIFLEVLGDMLQTVQGLQVLSSARSKIELFFLDVDVRNDQVQLLPLSDEFAEEILFSLNTHLTESQIFALYDKCSGNPLLLKMVQCMVSSGITYVGQIVQSLSSAEAPIQNGEESDSTILKKVKQLILIMLENLQSSTLVAFVGLISVNHVLNEDNAGQLMQQGALKFKTKSLLQALETRGLLHSCDYQFLDQQYILQGVILEIMNSEEMGATQIDAVGVRVTIKELSSSARMRAIEDMFQHLKTIRNLVEKGYTSAALRYADTHSDICNSGLNILRQLDDDQQIAVIEYVISLFTFEVTSILKTSQILSIIDTVKTWLSQRQESPKKKQLQSILGQCLLASGNPQEAYQLLQQCIRQQNSSEYDQYYCALSLYKQQRYKETIATIKEVLDTSQYIILGKGTHLLGMAFQCENQHELAQEAYVGAHLYARQHSDEVLIAEVAHSHGSLYHQLKSEELAKQRYVDAYQKFVRLDGAVSLRASDSLQGFALINASMKQYIIFQRAAQENLQVTQELVGENDGRIADLLSAMALVYESQGDYQKAEELYSLSIQITQKTSKIPSRGIVQLLAKWKRVANRQGVKIQHNTYRVVSSISQWVTAASSSVSLGDSQPEIGKQQAVSEQLPSNYKKSEFPLAKALSLPVQNKLQNIRESVSSSKTPRGQHSSLGAIGNEQKERNVPTLSLQDVEHYETHGTPGAPRIRSVLQSVMDSESIAPFGQSTSSGSNAISFQSEWKTSSPQVESSYSNIDFSQLSNSDQRASRGEGSILRKSLSDATSTLHGSHNDGCQTTPLTYITPKELIDQVNEAIKAVGSEVGQQKLTEALFETELTKMTQSPLHFDPRKSFYNPLYQSKDWSEQSTSQSSQLQVVNE
eukprot:TRINITY_DN4838_c0_g2_i1.p1 TRINITY_DN4838_c0_g2~~TRINITY_DN4838_c0_g2_i1.p1  ORF type:complete len:1458 (-),score=114.88 TRINITY_DN4838_c0_g2_i1:830-4849(-)